MKTCSKRFLNGKKPKKRSFNILLIYLTYAHYYYKIKVVKETDHA